MTGSIPRNYKINPTKDYIEKKELILKLRAEKLSYHKIGKALGISRQRVHQILKDYNSNGGNIAPGEYKCVECGVKENLQCHHKNFDSYDNRKSNLEWLCIRCHRKKHIGRASDCLGDRCTPRKNVVCTRLQDLCFEALRKQAEREDTTISAIARRILRESINKKRGEK